MFVYAQQGGVMRTRNLVTALSLLVSFIGAGCYYDDGTYYVPPASFDPTGSWTAYNDDLVGVSADYISVYDNFSGYYVTPPSTGAYIDGNFGVDSAQTFFGYPDEPPLGSPAIYGVPSYVGVQYDEWSNIVYINLTGELGTVATNPSAYIAIPATNGGATVQINPDPGQVYEFSFLNSRACYYEYSTFLTLGFYDSNNLDGFVTSRFDFVNDPSLWSVLDPTCDEIFAAFQDDFDYGLESSYRNGLLFDLVYNTSDFQGYYNQAAVDYRYIYALGGLQFDAGFFADRYSVYVPGALRGPNEFNINGAYIKNRMVNPAALEAVFKGNPQAVERFGRALARVRTSGVVNAQGLRQDGRSFPVRGSVAQATVEQVLSTRGSAAATVPGAGE